MSIKELSKYRGWKVWQIHDMHVCLLSIFYILIVDNLFNPFASLVLILSLGFYFMYGVMINDFFDRSYDITAGKKRAVHELSKNAFLGLIFLVIFISAMSLLYLQSIIYIVIYSLSYALATLYSAPIIRFKERGFLGIIINALIEKMLPVLAIFTYFNHFGMDTILFLVTSFLLQIVEIVTHQIHDYEADLKTGIRTFATDIGKDKALRAFRYFIVPLSMLSIILLFYIISIKIPYAIFIIAIVLLIYMVLFLLVLSGRLNLEEKIFPLYMSPLYLLINNAFPLFFALILVFTSFLNVILLIVALGSQYYLFKKFFKLLNEKIIIRTEIADA